MKKWLLIFLIALNPLQARADLFGGDLPLLAEIVINTLHTMQELQRQSSLLESELDGINDRINRIRTIAEIVKPEDWGQWKDPREALRRIQKIYRTLPPEYRSEKSDLIEQEISRAMSTIGMLSPEAQTTFQSGKEMEQRGANASPGVAQKLTASGVGTLISIEAQSQILQSHMVGLLAQLLAQANEKETRSIVSHGQALNGVSQNVGNKEDRFSFLAQSLRIKL